MSEPIRINPVALSISCG